MIDDAYFSKDISVYLLYIRMFSEALIGKNTEDIDFQESTVLNLALPS